MCVCVYSVLKYVYQMCFSSTLKPQSGHVRKLSLPTELKKKKILNPSSAHKKYFVSAAFSRAVIGQILITH